MGAKKLDLGQFSGGSEHFYRYNFGFVLTDGVTWTAQEAGCFWFVDECVLHSIEIRRKSNQPFITATLKVDVEQAKGVITFTDGNKNVLRIRHIAFTDFEYEELTVWIVDKTVLLPMEY